MIGNQHHYKVKIEWTGNNGLGTENYEVYSRSHTVSVNGKPQLECSSDTPFRGDAGKYNPEDFFVSAIASCHMLWYLHLCADNGIVVHAYDDDVQGLLIASSDKPGHFDSVTLSPRVAVAEQWMEEKALALHEEAHAKCFIANSCNFPVNVKPQCYTINEQ